ncbi:conserved hypothetical protein [uncultured delta proteobacterium]|uniref:Uncharacterized protein n=1 Tax=uncultured delta proteobacterium TaxID=34034 RepID=A0A212J4W9_9DELT|nr:conserved hypothetical protein [uncultured delta proteobacterium]
MGRVLTVRLSVTTYNEEDVFRSWPRLCALAWPGKGQVFQDGWKPNPEVFAPPVKAEPVRRGVMELAQGLLEESRLGDWDKDVKSKLAAGLRELEKNAATLEAALADWQPQAANTATNQIEDTLDSLEEKLA